MASMKYDFPLLDRHTRFTLWQVEMRAFLAQTDYDVALDSFGKNRIEDWTDEEKRIDRKKFNSICIIIFCRKFCARKLPPLYG